MSLGTCRSRSKSGCCRLTPGYCKRFSGSGKRKRSKSRRHRKVRRRKSVRRRKKGRSRGRRRKGTRGRRRKGRSRKKKCARPGPTTANPFLNYLRVFRRKHCGWPACKIAIEGAKCWCKMNEMERQKFYREACAAKKGKRKGKGRKRKGRRGRRGKRGRSRRGRRKSRSRRGRSRRGRSRKGRSRKGRRKKGGGCPM